MPRLRHLREVLVMDLISEIRSKLSPINIVSFSGGKDSTVVLQHVMEAIRGTKHKLYIVTADTLMEIPLCWCVEGEPGLSRRAAGLCC